MAYVPYRTVSDLGILAPELREFIAKFPSTIESAESANVVVNFMRAIPPSPSQNPKVTKRDVQISVPFCHEQPSTTIRVYKPLSVGNDEVPKAALLWMHHGGFFSSGPIHSDAFCSSIAAESNTIVVAPSYRQTPENPFPAPFDDTYQTLLWLTSHPEAREYGIDPGRIAVGGSSAGGTLAVGVSLKYRDEAREPSIRLLILDDASLTDKSTSYSSKHNPINKLWNAKVTQYMWSMYLPYGSGAISEEIQGYAVPALAKNLKGLPPTLVVCAQWDDLTNDAIAFAHRLLESGVPTEIHTYRGTFHVSDKLLHDAETSKRKHSDIVEALQAAFRVYI